MKARSLASSIVEAVTVREVSPGIYESQLPPENMGNAHNIAYGGFTMGAAVNAGCRSVEPPYRLYSAVGHYLGPAQTDRKLRCVVQKLRDTRTFATRAITVSQMQDDGQERSCMYMVTDFQLPEKASLLTYYAPPSRSPCQPEESVSMRAMRDKLFEEKKLSEEQKSRHERSFNVLERFFDQRHDPDGIMIQVLTGVAKNLATNQDHLPLTERTSLDWCRTKVNLNSHRDCASAMAFALDAALSFIPLSYSHKFLEDAGACSSLDFALRFFSNEPKFDEWHVREMKTIAGAEGRTYSEAKCWDQLGRMVAIMNQQSILRPPRQGASL